MVHDSNTVDYQKLYHLLFNRITDSVELIESGGVGSALKTLKQVQQQAEEIYISCAD